MNFNNINFDTYFKNYPSNEGFFGKYGGAYIPEELKDKRLEEVDRTPAENLAYQVGWTTLVLKWEEDEKKGIDVKTPSDKFKWNQLGELYQWFTDTYAHESLYELKEQLTENVKKIYPNGTTFI